MVYDWDPKKSATNLQKHGIAFVDATALWLDENLLTLRSRAEFQGDEIRFLFIGKIDAKHWTAITTIRSKKIRIISVRRSRKSEVKLYEKEND